MSARTKVLVIGALGQLGTEICKAYADCDLYRADRDGGDILLDITEPAAVRKVIVEDVRPDVVINTAAAHNVPECQERPEVAFAVNATAARDLAIACRECSARLVYISTDYVFGHGATRPLTEDDLPAPLNVYGASRLAGEHLVAAEWRDHIIVRTAALYGPAACRAKGGWNFVRLMLHLAETRGEVKVVTDEITTPTYAVSLAAQIRRVAERGSPGLYHATCGGECSWYEFAKAIFEVSGVSVRLMSATAKDFPATIMRPHYSVLQNKHLQDQGLDIMPDWLDALKMYLSSLSPDCSIAEGALS